MTYTPPRSTPRTTRLRRLYRHGVEGLVITPLDHTLACGPVTPRGWSLDTLVGELAGGGSDAVVVHKGAIRWIDPATLCEVSLVVHLNGSTPHAPDPDAKVALAAVEEALRLGADAVSVHVNLGSGTETRQLGDLARAAEACDRWNLPLLAMVYPRGPRIASPLSPDLVLHAVTVGADLGADLVKTAQLPDAAVMRDVVAQCPVPVLVAGGALRPETELLHDVERAMRAGAGGVALGRCAFAAPDPRATTARVAALVHRGASPIPSPRPHHLRGEHHVDDHPVVLARPTSQPVP